MKPYCSKSTPQPHQISRILTNVCTAGKHFQKRKEHFHIHNTLTAGSTVPYERCSEYISTYCTMSWARLVTNSHVWCLFLSWMDWRMHLMENCHHFRALKGANENYDKGHFILTSADSITIIIRLMVPWTIQWMLQYRLKVSRSFLETSFSKLDSSKFQGPRLKSNCEMFEAFWEIMEGFQETFETDFRTFGSWKRPFHVIIFSLLKVSTSF